MPTQATGSSFDVVIAGAGFAGLALARALAASLGPELRVLLIDRATTHPAHAPDDGRASALSASSQRMLAVLGVWPHVADASCAVSRIEITDSELGAGIRPVLLTYDNELSPLEPGSFIVPNAPLLAALARSVAADTGTALALGRTILEAVPGPTAIDIQLDRGERIKTSLLVAADGRRSALRSMFGIKTVGWSYDQIGIVTIVAHAEPHQGVAVQHFLPAGPFAILPLPGNRSCITWSEASGEARRILALDDAGFLAEVERRFGGRLGRIELAGPRSGWPLDLVLARATVAQRFALVGDAAHGVHPIAGQGLNLAFRDCAALTEVVSDSARVGLDLGNADALDHYQRWRRYDAFTSAATFDVLNRLFSHDGMLLRAARDVGLSIVDRIPALKTHLVREAAGLTGDLPRLLRGETV